MRMVVRGMLVVTVAGALLAIVLSIWPGVLNDLLLAAVLFAVIWVPIVLLAIVVVAISLYRRGKAKPPERFPKGEAIAAAVVAVVTLALLVFCIPRRTAFVLSRSAFDAAVQSAPTSARGGVRLQRRLGVYRVDQHAADPRGGVYFCVHRGTDGIGPDVMSYGFAHRPNELGSPFGAAHYATFHVVGHWYWFRASDDWH